MTTEPREGAPDAFETAILEAVARERPALMLDVRHLGVVGRRYTGVGSYTDFACDEPGEREAVSLQAHIAVPGVPSGMGAVLYCHGGKVACLETFTYGNEYWTGKSEGFSIG